MHSLRKTGCALALLVLPLGGYAAKPAADLPGATLPELLIWAEQHNPELTAMQHDVEAAEARVQPAGALPDPMFSVEWRDIPVSYTHLGADTLLARIVHLVGEAQRTRAPIQKLADVIAAYFVQVVIGIAIVTALAWWFFGPEPKFAYAFLNAIAVLIIACPCAVGLATPISMTCLLYTSRCV